MVDNKHDIIGSPLTALSFVFPYFDREPRRHIKRLFAAVPLRAAVQHETRFNFHFSHAFSDFTPFSLSFLQNRTTALSPTESNDTSF